jgi:hypothetical protein
MPAARPGQSPPVRDAGAMDSRTAEMTSESDETNNHENTRAHTHLLTYSRIDLGVAVDREIR